MIENLDQEFKKESQLVDLALSQKLNMNSILQYKCYKAKKILHRCNFIDKSPISIKKDNLIKRTNRNAKLSFET